ncbi:unnamed protein product [Ceutorhynchus assimilis]|uniref:Regulatory protein zeste n=1 Tax=Ceutorhynchus assimilis TaxID=467358 RepID=A0A9N9MMX9_9CUCU|nr:unnamed protein product [Ceutorhynchus assimilis]
MRVRSEHWEVLLTFCEKNPQLVTNRFSGFKGRAKGTALWQNIASKLNSLGFGEKSVDGWRKTLTDWKSKTKNKATALKKEQQQTGGGPPQLPPLTPFEERLLLLMGTKALEGDEAVPELGFGKVQIPGKPMLKNNMPKPIMEVSEIEIAASYAYDHDYVENAEVAVPSTSQNTTCAEDVQDISRGIKRKMEPQGSKRSRPFRRRTNTTVGVSNDLLNINQQSVEVLQNIKKNTESLASSVEKISNNTESIANSLKDIADIVRNAYSTT